MLIDLNCSLGIGKNGRMEKQESGTRNRSRNRNRNLNWDRGKLGSTKTSSRYPCGNKIQDGVLLLSLFWEIFNTVIVIPKIHSHSESDLQKKKGKCILLVFLAVINCDCSGRLSNFRQIETTTNQKPIDCEKQPLLVCDVWDCSFIHFLLLSLSYSFLKRAHIVWALQLGIMIDMSTPPLPFAAIPSQWLKHWALLRNG